MFFGDYTGVRREGFAGAVLKIVAVKAVGGKRNFAGQFP